MYIKKAIGILEYIKKWFDDQFVHEEDDAIDTAINALEEVQQYRSIGTVEECRDAVEKQKAKKYRRDAGNNVKCPVCGTYTTDIFEHKYCSYCGQRLE